MKTMRRLLFLTLSTIGVGMALSATAAAQPANNCPPGSWFCEGSSQQPPPGQPLQPLPGTQPQQPPVVYQPAPPPPPVVVYQPAPPPVVVVQQPPAAKPTYVYTTTTRRVWRPEWGINLRLEGALFGSNYQNDIAGIGGLGVGLRVRPSPWFAIEGDVDFLGGRDYNNYRRGETAFSANALFFVNPQSRVQLYFIAGIGGSIARVVDDQSSSYDRIYNWGYFGGQAGGGVEFRLAKSFALNADLRGFIRGRTDSGARTQPEFVNPQTGQTTNLSGGALITGGMTFYF
jgi:opacity protein-like surface antigen